MTLLSSAGGFGLFLSSAGFWGFSCFALTVIVFSPFLNCLYWETIIVSPSFNSSTNVADQFPLLSTVASLLIVLSLFFDFINNPTVYPGAAVPLNVLSPS